MPIQKPIESVVNQLSEKPQFIFASAAELNEMLDQTKRFPVVGLVAETAINLSYRLSQQRGDNKGRIFRIKAGQQVEFKTIYHLNTFDTLTAGGYITLTLQTMYHETL